jgi:hypothetical protein
LLKANRITGIPQGKNKMKEQKTCKCPECEKREMEHTESEEMNFAILVALVPILTITLFSNVGLL